MPPLKPIKRNELIFFLRKLGYEGPYAGSKHQFMIKENHSLTIPNPHQSDIGKEFLKRILKQANIDTEDWIKL